MKSPFTHPDSFGDESGQSWLAYSPNRKDDPWLRVRPVEPFEVDGITYNWYDATNYICPMIQLRADDEAMDPAVMLMSEPELPESQFQDWLLSESGEDWMLRPPSSWG